MKTRHDDFSKTILARAIQLALLALCAAPGLAAAQGADDDEEGAGAVKELVCPTNFVELGAMDVSHTAPKYGEYNGLNQSGGYGLASFSLQGGSGHCQRGGAMRWEVTGKDLGTTSRNIGAAAGEQGRWNIGLNFDQLRHYTTTGYQTPYQGSLGGNTFVLSPAFGVINTTAPGGAQNLTPAQLASFRGVDVYNERQNTTFTAGYAFNDQWNVKFDFKHLDMSGGKLISAATDAYNLTSLGGFNYGGQRISVLMNPTKSTTNNFNAALNWVGDKAYASVEYYASLYRDSYSGLTWSNAYVAGGTADAPNPLPGASPGSAFPVDTMSTPPSNQLHQLSLTGGYFFTPKTKLTGGLSLGVNTQNSGYDGAYTSTPNTAPGLPVNSLDGRVLNKHADARLTHQFSPALNLNVGLKYNERSNNTSVHTYNFLHLGGSAVTVSNAPMSYRTEQLDANLAYRIDKRQRLNFGYAYNHVNRWCNSPLANIAQGVLPANGAGYYSVASCAQVPKSSENSLSLGYKLSLLDSVNFDAGYTHSDRKASVNPSFYNPMQGLNQGYENFGWMAWFQGSRRQDLVKGGVSWQLTKQFTLGLNGRYTKDNYYDSALGVQKGHSSSINLDADYALSENFSLGAYVSWQRRTRDLTSASDRNLLAPPVNLWYNSLSDRDTAIGINARQKLMGGKFELTEDLSYSYGRSGYNTTLGPNIAPAVGSSGATPDITSKLWQLRLTGSYAFSKASRLTFGYIYQRLRSNDYLFNAYQYGYTPTALLPSGQVSPDYKVNAVFVVYRYSFQ